MHVNQYDFAFDNKLQWVFDIAWAPYNAQWQLEMFTR